MKALLWYKKNDVRIEDVPIPKVEPGTVKIQIKWCGICGSDLHEYLAGPIAIPVDEPHVLTGKVAPVILGHEASGLVTEIGEGVEKLKVGDRVTIEPVVVCGKCPACLDGKYNMCENIGWFGNCGIGGGFAEYAVFSERFVHKIPDEISYEKAALIEPLAVGLHAVRTGNVLLGQTAVVSGAGPIGLAIMEALKAAGVSKLIVIQRKSVRQKYALNMGADIVIDPNEVDAVKEIKSLTGGVGADVAFETTGSEQCFNINLEAIKYSGTLVVISLWEQPIKINPNLIVYKEKKIAGSIVYRYEFPSTIELLAKGDIKGEGYITKKIFLDDIITEGFNTLTGSEKKQHVKILVTPDKSLL